MGEAEQSGQILEIFWRYKPTGFAERMDIGCEEREKQKLTSRFLAGTPRRMDLPLTELVKPVVGSGWQEEDQEVRLGL